MFTGQRHTPVAVPQLMELGGLALAAAGAAGAAVSETGQRRTHFHTFHRHGALNGLTKLNEERETSWQRSRIEFTHLCR